MGNPLKTSTRGTKVPVPGKTVGTPGVVPKGVQDAQTCHDLATMRQQHNWETGKRPGPQWLKDRADAEQRRLMEGYSGGE